MDDCINNPIGNTLDALLRPQTPRSPSGVLRVACLHDDDGALSDTAREVGLEVVYAHSSGETVGDISDQSNIPPFDLLASNLPIDAWDEVEGFAFALRFLRVRRPVAFLLVGEASIVGDFIQKVQSTTRRLRYQVDGRGDFVVGTRWQNSFQWESEDSTSSILRRLAGDVFEHSA